MQKSTAISSLAMPLLTNLNVCGPPSSNSGRRAGRKSQRSKHVKQWCRALRLLKNPTLKKFLEPLPGAGREAGPV